MPPSLFEPGYIAIKKVSSRRDVYEVLDIPCLIINQLINPKKMQPSKDKRWATK